MRIRVIFGFGSESGDGGGMAGAKPSAAPASNVWGVAPGTPRILVMLGFLAAIMGWSAPAMAALEGLERVAGGLSEPVFVTNAPGDRDRLFIAQRGGAIRILDLDTGSLAPTPFLSIPGVDTTSEGGLLGMAFHPDYNTNGKFYVYLTAADSLPDTAFSTYVREYTVSANPNVANTSFNPIISFGQPQPNHNAGWIGFSPNDNYLYISSGDGGGGNDSGAGHTPGTGNAQDITNNLLGKMLRIDVDGDDFPGSTPDALANNYAIPSDNPFAGSVVGDDEIWSYGLRNPFRDSFDRLTGDLWIGDVGQSAREEVNFQSASNPGGDNYGWRLREGTIATPTGGVGGLPPEGNVEPIYDYGRSGTFGGITVIGGYVYRGPDPDLQGLYFFGDAGQFGAPETVKLWTLDPSIEPVTVVSRTADLTPDEGSAIRLASFGEDAKGNLYAVYVQSGDVYRIATNALLPGDFDADGDVDPADYDEWQRTFGGALANPAAQGAGGNAIADAADYVVWRKNLGSSVHDDVGSGSQTVPEPAAAIYFAQLTAVVAFGMLVRRRE